MNSSQRPYHRDLKMKFEWAGDLKWCEARMNHVERDICISWFKGSQLECEVLSLLNIHDLPLIVC